MHTQMENCTCTVISLWCQFKMSFQRSKAIIQDASNLYLCRPSEKMVFLKHLIYNAHQKKSLRLGYFLNIHTSALLLVMQHQLFDDQD